MASDSINGNPVNRDLVYLDHSPKKVALVCMGPSITDYLGATLTQEFTPDRWDEVWTINMSANCFACDVVFWMDDLIEQEKFKPNLFRHLRKIGVPVITSQRRPEVVPNSYDYPIQEVGRLAIPIFGKPYLNNGVAMAIGYALVKGVTHMSIFGADFSYPNRDFAESGRACVESWITVACNRNVTIELAPQTSLMDNVKDHGIYGYSEQPPILLEDGQIFQYVKQSEIGKYVPEAGYIPEDSAGDQNVVSGRNPGSNPEPAPSVVGGGEPSGDQAPDLEAGAVDVPGPGLRDRPAGRDDQEPDHAHLGASRGNGRLPPGTEIPVLPVAGEQESRRAP